MCGSWELLHLGAKHEMEYNLLLFYIILALGVSFLCSILESVLLSISHGHIKLMQNSGKRSGDIWAKLKENDAVSPITAILTLNTIAHTMGAAGVGAEVQRLFGESALTISSVFLTIGVLLLSEILPKTIGSTYWKGLSSPAAHATLFLTRITYPIVFLIIVLKKMLPHQKVERVTRKELAVLADIGEEEGAIEADEEKVITNLLRLAEISVKEVMTPRVVVTAFPITHTIRQVLDEIPILRFSRIPVYGDNIDDLKGLIIRSEILTAASNDEWEKTLSEFTNSIRTISDEANVDGALDIFLKSRQQLVVVQDEFGGTSGILTMEDVIETLLGEEIVDETDEVEDMRELAMELTNDDGASSSIISDE